MHYLTVEYLTEKATCYHKDCYSKIVNKRNYKRAVSRYEKATKQKDHSYLSPKRGRPSTAVPSIASTSPSNLSDVPKKLHSTEPPYNSDLCTICQKGGILHKVMTTEKVKTSYGSRETQ